MIDRELARKCREYAARAAATVAADEVSPWQEAAPRDGGRWFTALRKRVAEVRPAPPPEPEPGQIWVVESPTDKATRDLLLLAVADHVPWRGIVLTEEVWLADAEDLVIPGDASPTKSALAVCLSRDVPLFPKFLRVFVGNVDDSLLLTIQMLRQRQLTGGFSRRPLGVVPRHRVPGAQIAASFLLRWEVGSEGASTGFREYLSGPQIEDEDDPRLDARTVFAEKTQYFEEALDLELAAAESPHVSPARAFLTRLADQLQAVAGICLAAVAPPLGAVYGTVARSGDKTPPPDGPASFEVVVGGIKCEVMVRTAADLLHVRVASFVYGTDTPIAGVVVFFVAGADPPIERRADDLGIVEFVVQRVDFAAKHRLEIEYAGERRTIAW